MYDGVLQDMGGKVIFTERERRSIARRFIAFRKRNLLSQRELAALMQTSAASVCTAEGGVLPVGSGVLRKFREVTAEFDRLEKTRVVKVPRVTAKAPRFNRGAI